MENLTAFVRERSRRNEAARVSQDFEQRVSRRAYLLWQEAGQPEGRAEEFWADAAKQDERGDPPATDIATVLVVISRRSENDEKRAIDFSGAILKRCDLRGAHLEGACLAGAHMAGANLAHAHLEGASLWDAHFNGASFSRAHLEGVNFLGSHLEGADFSNARCKGANFSKTYLKGTSFAGCKISILRGRTSQEPGWRAGPPFQVRILKAAVGMHISKEPAALPT